MKLRDCNLGDIMHVCCQLRDDEWDQFVALGYPKDIDAAIARCYSFHGPKWAFVDDETDADKALVVGGFIPLRAGVYSSWFLGTKAAWSLYGRDITEMAAERVRWALRNGAHRIETVCLASRKLAQRWYQTVGLRLESTMQGFCVDGSDAVLYVATKDQRPCA